MSERVAVYWNIHRAMWSVRCVRTGRVIGHRSDVTLTGVTFRVSEAGRQRVLREGVKNVHAWAVGTVAEGSAAPPGEPVSVRYNPRTGPRFVTRGGGAAVASAGIVRFTPDRGVYAWAAVTESEPAPSPSPR